MMRARYVCFDGGEPRGLPPIIPIVEFVTVKYSWNDWPCKLRSRGEQVDQLPG